jgi:membrane protease subunit HflK
VVAQAEGDSQRFRSVLTEYQKAPTVTRDRLYIDTMQQVYSNVSKVMVDSRNGSNLLYLPLDKLIQQAAPGGSVQMVPQAPASASLPTDAGAAGAAGADARSRDGGRSRDRDGR